MNIKDILCSFGEIPNHTSNTKTRAYSCVNLSEMTVQQLADNPNILLHFSNIGMFSINFIWSCIQIWAVSQDNFNSTLLKFIAVQKERSESHGTCGYKALNEVDVCTSVEQLMKVYASCSKDPLRDYFFEKVLLFSNTEEDLFFIVSKGYGTPSWRKATRKLLKMTS